MTIERPSFRPHSHARDLALLRASLVATWLATAVASALEAHGQSASLMAAAGLHAPLLAALALWGGVAADLGIGLWLWLRPSRAAVDAALAATAVLTIVATVLLPGLWLHPLGPLLKNLPIVAALVVLRRSLW